MVGPTSKQIGAAVMKIAKNFDYYTASMRYNFSKSAGKSKGEILLCI